MNLAVWLVRAGLSHGGRPALGYGSHVVRSYGKAAERAARLAAALRDRFDLGPGERVAVAAKNTPDYLELMFGIWHAGLAACPPMPSCTDASSAIFSSTLAPAFALHPTSLTPRSLPMHRQ